MVNGLEEELLAEQHRHDMAVLEIVGKYTRGVLPTAPKRPPGIREVFATIPRITAQGIPWAEEDKKPAVVLPETEPRRRSTPEEVEAVLVDVVEALKGSEEGAGREWLRQRLGFSKADKGREAMLSKALGLGIESHQLKLVGEKRSAKYVLPSEAQAKGRVVRKKK